jgi:hypothetical protein
MIKNSQIKEKFFANFTETDFRETSKIDVVKSKLRYLINNCNKENDLIDLINLFKNQDVKNKCFATGYISKELVEDILKSEKALLKLWILENLYLPYEEFQEIIVKIIDEYRIARANAF